MAIKDILGDMDVTDKGEGSDPVTSTDTGSADTRAAKLLISAIRADSPERVLKAFGLLMAAVDTGGDEGL